MSFLSQLNFTVVVSNLNVTQEPKWPSTLPLIVKSKVVNVGSERIGFVGYVLKDTPRYVLLMSWLRKGGLEQNVEANLGINHLKI